LKFENRHGLSLQIQMNAFSVFRILICAIARDEAHGMNPKGRALENYAYPCLARFALRPQSHSRAATPPGTKPQPGICGAVHINKRGRARICSRSLISNFIERVRKLVKRAKQTGTFRPLVARIIDVVVWLQAWILKISWRVFTSRCINSPSA
jgi:hypothetical protein